MDNAPHKRSETGLFKEVWKAHNKLIDHIRSIAVMPSGNRGVVVHRTANGTILNADSPIIPEPKEPSVLERYIVWTVEADYLNCFRLNNDGTPDQPRDQDNSFVFTKIAKPFNLRRDQWHGVEVEYYSDETPTALSGVKIYYSYRSVVMREARIGGSGSSNIELQVIRPQYVPGKSVIFASKVENKTGVASITNDLLDINADGRAWAAVL